jgi:hypothetical protein
MATTTETQALIAKEITVSVTSHLRIPPGVQAEAANSLIRKEVCKLYEDVFNTVKRLTEE